MLLLLLLLKLPGERVHLQLLSQADLLQAVVEVGLRAAARGGRQSEDAHDLPLVFSGVNEQAEADQDHQQVDIRGLVPRFVHRVVYRVGLVPQNPVSAHGKCGNCHQTTRRNIQF